MTTGKSTILAPAYDAHVGMWVGLTRKTTGLSQSSRNSCGKVRSRLGLARTTMICGIPSQRTSTTSFVDSTSRTQQTCPHTTLSENTVSTSRMEPSRHTGQSILILSRDASLKWHWILALKSAAGAGILLVPKKKKGVHRIGAHGTGPIMCLGTSWIVVP